MLFNSVEFAIFLPIVFLLYWTVASRSLFVQNLFVTVVSYVFYGWWDIRFLALIAISTLIDFAVGAGLSATNSPGRRKVLLWTSLVSNLGLLGFFKYCNFFVESFASAFTFFGIEANPVTLNIVLPVGISFYTLQTLSYTIDVYRKDLEPTRDLVGFMAFVTFFPQLVAGPIERASNLLPQFGRHRHFDYAIAVGGLRQILWGMFTKVVIADNCAACANAIFNNTDQYTGVTMVFGAILFSFQIYGDFSGYSNIAIGSARLFGFELMRNFDCPYFSRDIAEFWRRWHISLSTWFRDYVYIPLGGSRGGPWKSVRNVFVVFLLSGFWHGANWTFIIWGALNAAYFLPLLLLKKNRANVNAVASGRLLPSVSDLMAMATTFTMTAFAWIFFRADSVEHAVRYIRRMAIGPFLHWPEVVEPRIAVLVAGFAVIEWFGREQEYAISSLGLSWPRPLRLAMYYGFCVAVAIWSGKQQDFIYFQF